ncbi:hypothetical protein GOV08_05325 [Candidatus Woesearchaeota archaeon]|nr:hypothetical protein [Candidatus Woesearchaeota archaeon]
MKKFINDGFKPNKMRFGELERRDIRLNGEDINALVLPFSDYDISQEMVRDVLESTEDPNIEAHLGDDAWVMGFHLEAAMQYAGQEASRRVGEGSYECTNYDFRFITPVPVDSTVEGEMIILPGKNGDLRIVPEAWIKGDEDKRLFSRPKKQRYSNLTFGYNSTPGKIIHDRGVQKRIKQASLDQFIRGMQLDINGSVPNSFLVALSSWAIGEKVKADGLFQGKTPIYSSREVKFYKGSKDMFIGEDITQDIFIQDRKRIAATTVEGYNSILNPIFEASSSLLLLNNK